MRVALCGIQDIGRVDLSHFTKKSKWNILCCKRDVCFFFYAATFRIKSHFTVFLLYNGWMKKFIFVGGAEVISCLLFGTRNGIKGTVLEKLEKVNTPQPILPALKRIGQGWVTTSHSSFLVLLWRWESIGFTVRLWCTYGFSLLPPS